MSEHRDSAEQLLVDVEYNPVMSAEQSLMAAQVHALLGDRTEARRVADPAVQSGVPRADAVNEPCAASSHYLSPFAAPAWLPTWQAS